MFGLVLFGTFCAGLAIVVKLTSERQRAWVERALKVGDLRVLNGIAFRRTARPSSDVVDRLYERGFLVKTTRGCCCRMTLMGWIAILLRNTSARRSLTRSNSE
jgi:hypothetical protein